MHDIYKVILVLLIITIFIGLIFYLTFPNRLKSGYQDFCNVVHKISPDNALKVLTWNIAYLYGPGSEGIGYQKQTKEFFEKKISDAIDLLKKEDADIILLQEVDIRSKKSNYINQVKVIAQALGYNYAIAKSWHCRYVPYPIKSILNHFGYVESGGAILSKYKIENNYVFLHQKPNKNYFFNLFFIHRYSQVVEVEINDNKYSIVNNHLEAFSKINRQQQILDVLKLIENKNILVIGGDLNTLPSIAKKKSHFTEYDFDDYIDDKTYDILADKYKDTLPIEKYQNNESEYFTFSSAHEDRKLDYIFTPKYLETIEFNIIKSNVSDHYPICATLLLNSQQ